MTAYVPQLLDFAPVANTFGSGSASRGRMFFDATAREVHTLHDAVTHTPIYARPTAMTLLTVNLSNADRDIIFEGFTNPTLLVLDAGLDAVGIGGNPVSGFALAVTGATRSSGRVHAALDGTISAVAISMGGTDDPNTGFIHPAADQLAVVQGGIQRALWANTTLTLNNSSIAIPGANDSTGTNVSVTAGAASGYGAIASTSLAGGGGLFTIGYGQTAAGTYLGETIARAAVIEQTLSTTSKMLIGTSINIPLHLGTNNISRISVTGAGVTTLNPTGIDADTIIRGLANDNLVFVDAGADYVAIGHAAPTSILDAAGTVTGYDQHAIRNHDANTGLFVSNTNSTASSTARVHLIAGTGATDVQTQLVSVPVGYTNASFSSFAAGKTLLVTRGSSTRKDLLIGPIGAGTGGKTAFHVGATNELFTAANERAAIGVSEFVVNEPSNDYDFRVEGLSNASLFTVDAGLNMVGIGRALASHGARLDVDNQAAAVSIATFRDNGTAVLTVIDGGAVEMAEISAPATPSSGYGRFYAKTDGFPYWKNDAGVEYGLANVYAVEALSGTTPTVSFLETSGLTKSLTVTGNTTFSTSNLAAGVSVTVRVVGDTVARTLSFPAWTFLGNAPTEIAANDTAVLALTSFGTTDANVIAVWGTDAEAPVVVNEAGVNSDFRVESENNEHMLFIDASADVVGIGTATPDGDGSLSLKTHTAFAGSEHSIGTAAVQTTTVTQTTVFAKTLADQTVYNFEVSVVARDTAAAHRAAYKFCGTFYREGGGATQEGATASLMSVESNAGLDATFTVSGNDVRVSVTGLAATTINWAATIIWQAVSVS